ncbi:NUDIX domain-containing protein [Kitasatospora sp. NPDC048194]|uniref:NUDIX domain-containing protein n=1 Tax=Kitasatospora sp. NPDC048194 TaxID=3364045 RepID=UPI0037189E8D
MTETVEIETVETADVVCIREGVIRSVLLIKRGDEPFAGSDALPGGYVEAGEKKRKAAARELGEETGVRVEPERLRKVGVYDKPGRDPRGPVRTTAYLVVMPSGTQATAGDDAAYARWVPVADLQDLLEDPAGGGFAFDHGQILLDALRLSGDFPSN